MYMKFEPNLSQFNLNSMINRYYKTLVSIIILISNLNFASAQILERRANWQAKFQSPESNSPGALIISLEKNSPLEKAGLLANDVIIRVNNELVKDDETWVDITYGIRANKPIDIQALREHKMIQIQAYLDPIPKESHENIDTLYEEVTSIYGITQRLIITKPRKQGKQPALILIGGLSCSSTEIDSEISSNWQKVLNDLVEKTGIVMLRIEKPGIGDSQGNCSESDFLTDLAGYRAAIRYLKSKSYVDTSKIIVFGSSMGSALAPLLANEFDLAGVISDGTFFKTWFEHMLEIERRIRQMSGDTESEIVKKMNNYYIPMYYGMLIEKKTFKEIEEAYPALKDYNYHSARHMYGRPVEYYQQLQDFDLAGEWEKIKVPVRIMRGTNDWIMSSFDNKMIIDVLKKNGHQDHLLYEYPGLDHWNTIHKSAKASFEGEAGRWENNISLYIVDWVKELANM